jgi:hypothetical protein
VTLEDAQHRLDVLGRWCAAGLLAGSPGAAAVRSCEVWLKAHGEAVDRGRMRALASRIQELEAELAKPRGTARASDRSVRVLP